MPIVRSIDTLSRAELEHGESFRANRFARRLFVQDTTPAVLVRSPAPSFLARQWLEHRERDDLFEMQHQGEGQILAEAC